MLFDRKMRTSPTSTSMDVDRGQQVAKVGEGRYCQGAGAVKSCAADVVSRADDMT